MDVQLKGVKVGQGLVADGNGGDGGAPAHDDGGGRQLREGVLGTDVSDGVATKK